MLIPFKSTGKRRPRRSWLSRFICIQVIILTWNEFDIFYVLIRETRVVKSFKTVDSSGRRRIRLYGRRSSFRHRSLGRLLIRNATIDSGWRSLVRGLGRVGRLVMARRLLLYRLVIYVLQWRWWLRIIRLPHNSLSSVIIRRRSIMCFP